MGSGADGLHKMEYEGRFLRIAEQVGKLVEEKNRAYGSSFAKCGDFLKLLYPNGIPVEKYTDALTTVRIFDKLMRIATKKEAFGESPFRDIAGYAILGIARGEEPVPAFHDKTPIDEHWHP